VEDPSFPLAPRVVHSGRQPNSSRRHPQSIPPHCAAAGAGWRVPPPPPPRSAAALRIPRAQAWCRPPIRQLTARQDDWRRIPAVASSTLPTVRRHLHRQGGGGSAAMAAGDGSMVVAQGRSGASHSGGARAVGVGVLGLLTRSGVAHASFSTRRPPRWGLRCGSCRR
jgi:hypothetical protein